MKKIAGQLAIGRFVVPYRVYGEAETTLVCLSGAKQTMSAWRSFISYFQQDYRIIVFDMPGQGRAKILDGPAGVTLNEQVDVLHELVNHLGIGRNADAYLAGGSWGSVVAAAYASVHVDVFSKLALGSFGTKPNAVLKLVISQVQSLVEERRFSDIAPMMIDQFGQYIPKTLQRQIVAQFNAMSEQQFQSLYEHSVFVTEMGDLSKFIDLAAIRAETLIMMGQYDTILDLFDARNAAGTIPNCQYLVAKGAGHFLHWEKGDLLSVYAAFFDQWASAKETLNAMASGQ